MCLFNLIVLEYIMKCNKNSISNYEVLSQLKYFIEIDIYVNQLFFPKIIYLRVGAILNLQTLFYELKELLNNKLQLLFIIVKLI